MSALRVIAGLVLISVSLYCLNAQTRGTGDGNSNLAEQYAAFRTEVIRATTEQRAAYAEDLRTRQDLLQRFSEQQEAHTEYILRLESEIIGLKQRITSLESADTGREQRLGQRFGALGDGLAAERRARLKADRRIVAEISKEIAASVAPPSRSASSGDTQAPGLAAVSPTEAVETPTSRAEPPTYRVVKGDTLGAIAKAFKVSLRDLMTSNKLTSHTIYIDQKLKIPPEQ